MRSAALQILEAALQAVHPGSLLQKWVKRDGDILFLGDFFFDRRQFRHLNVLAVGKAASAMADAVEQEIGDLITAGVVVTKYDHAIPLQWCTTMETGHPVPDENGYIAANKVLQFVSNLAENDLLIVLLSGGASALLNDTANGIEWSAIRVLTHELLRSGADIREINTIRKHLSTLKGGQLARLAHPAKVVCFALSDVMGNHADVIGSGLTVPDPTTFRDAWLVLEKYGLIRQTDPAILRRLQLGMDGLLEETPKPGDHLFGKTHFTIIGDNHLALRGAVVKAEALGYLCKVIPDSLLGDVRESVSMILELSSTWQGARPACLLMGGEVTVTVRGNGKGGRCQELALRILHAWRQAGFSPQQVPLVMAVATDGTDGPTEVAGGIADGELLEWVYREGVDTASFLEQNDSYTFFSATDAQVITGPTHTNVMDLVIVLLG